MKLFERVILGIFRKPVKSMILLCVMFVICSMLSCSLILYNTTQSTKDKVNSLVAPTLSIDTPIHKLGSIGAYLNKNQFQTLMKYEEELYKTISNYDEISYFDYSYDSTFEKELVEDLKTIDVILEKYPIKGYNYVTANNHDSYFIKNNSIKMIEGRFLTKEEIENGSNAIVIPRSSGIIDGKNVMLNVGDKIKIYLPIYRENPLEYENLGNYEIDYNQNIDEINNQILEYNEKYRSYVYETYEYEVYVVGIYEGEMPFNEGIKKDGIISNKFYKNIFNDYIERINYLEKIGEIKNDVNFSAEKISLFNYFEVDDLDNLEIVSNKIKGELKELNNLIDQYEKECGHLLDRFQLKVSSDTYLKVAGPLESMNMISKIIVIVTLSIGTIILFVVCVLMIKDRRKEIGILLSIGEGKKRVMFQMLCEVMIIGIIAIGLSTAISSHFSKTISDIVLENNKTHVELTDEEQGLLGNLTQESILDDYKVNLESTDKFLIVTVIGTMISITSTISVLFVLKMNPKDILM